jgi:hypothetical protein
MDECDNAQRISSNTNNKYASEQVNERVRVERR